ncbi:DUF3800 domain-containing protein [Sphingomonas sp. Leaf33]|uniref:DUF3800 domain-containing protein n=1 Tax=Sphingomonas sp. Leaf33 TaxID=1736215 RepID=UPI00138F5575|nr:DUF3800 domain-containing protein [Sphingomonas sp. Leaf33]
MDDSKDEKSICFSALMIPSEKWLEAFDHLIAMRRAMKASHGIYTRLELHATDWLGGRGNVAPTTVRRAERMKLFDSALDEICKIPDIAIFNAFGPRASEETLFKYLIQRFENTVKARQDQAIVISDEGKNYDHLLRKMRRINYIPSARGAWQSGATSKNIPAERVVEDIVYRDSRRSLFIQAADFCAFSLLRFESPTDKARAMGFDQSFLRLEPVLFKRAFAADPRKLGIIRA